MNFLIRLGVPEMLALWENSKMKIENPPQSWHSGGFLIGR